MLAKRYVTFTRTMGQILIPSVQSLFIQMRMNGHNISSGTGFVVNSPRGPILITNRHNVTGRNINTDELLSKEGHIPDEIQIYHSVEGDNAAQYVIKSVAVLQDYKPLWIEHPILGAKADFVALILTDLENVKLYPYNLEIAKPQIVVRPSDTVSVIGFPFGISGGGKLAIWATGSVATELDMNHNNLPTFLIDCRARPGQSGSAVVAQRNTGIAEFDDGHVRMNGEKLTRFLGIYSGRINEQSDLGIVWKAAAIKELADSII